ncbi:hypothetical protein [Pseudovibrio exalbescens]|uniref:hypothetical protein n=1 Tax=Pseudovibrio exalbescens TaxID=197461 RepID=UPI000C9B3E95|nr:hypothetical protein [Pseudovibrio exalbescens]
MPSFTFDLKPQNERQQRVHVVYGPGTFSMICSCGSRTVCRHMVSLLAAETEQLTSNNAQELEKVVAQFKAEVVPVYQQQVKDEEIA